MKCRKMELLLWSLNEQYPWLCGGLGGLDMEQTEPSYEPGKNEHNYSK